MAKNTKLPTGREAVTLSTRFDGEERFALETACIALGWSASKLIHDATIDFARRINESDIGERIDDLLLTSRRP